MLKALANGGLIRAVEGAALGAFLDALIEALSSTPVHVDWKHIAAVSLGSAFLALRNYVKEAPRAPWTAEERANGGTK